ncbi:D-2-hydroxyacid dehydrogenase [Halioglobus maricola]|uniref:D-2-hydroxyacid dehydrogenase n=1 Tax=Halioglobus maricola TaxID=2601894 RepID=A0A5P9NGF9_9GAMM|nr:D-2-hydroxyacid dehydrogenase [Halioglobus maricola]QFU74645.1 D-2-hydroxyacid dehydrogenase [Halioglobus maricola]
MRNILLLIFTALISVPTLGSPSPEAQALIEQLSLREGPTPVRSHPNWAPKKIVVAMPAQLVQAVPGYKDALLAAAGDVPLTFVTGESVSAELADADALIGICRPQLIEAASDSLLWVHNWSAGVDRCPMEAFDNRVLSNSKRLMGPAIAEHTIAMLLALSRNLPLLVAAQQDGQWLGGAARNMPFGELEGKTMLVVGLGGIGTEIARRGHALGMQITATRNSSRTGPDFVKYVGLGDELHKLAGEADVIVNALPLTPATTGLFNKAFFDAAKPGAMFLSIGRGKSTDTDALMAALESGQIYGAGLDVTDPEPLPADHPLWKMDNVIITPHLSASGAGTIKRVSIVTIENLRRYVAGDALLNVVNTQAGY